MSLWIGCQFKDREYSDEEKNFIAVCFTLGLFWELFICKTIVFVLVAVILDAVYHEKTYAVETHPIYQSEKMIIQFGAELESESNYCSANYWFNSEIYRFT